MLCPKRAWWDRAVYPDNNSPTTGIAHAARIPRPRWYEWFAQKTMNVEVSSSRGSEYNNSLHKPSPGGWGSVALPRSRGASIVGVHLLRVRPTKASRSREERLLRAPLFYIFSQAFLFALWMQQKGWYHDKILACMLYCRLSLALVTASVPV